MSDFDRDYQYTKAYDKEYKKPIRSTLKDFNQRPSAASIANRDPAKYKNNYIDAVRALPTDK